jgi:hypothetical protein
MSHLTRFMPERKLYQMYIRNNIVEIPDKSIGRKKRKAIQLESKSLTNYGYMLSN